MTLTILLALAAPQSQEARPQTQPTASIVNRQARGEPAAVTRKRGTRCRIVKRAGQDKHVCTKAAARR